MTDETPKPEDPNAGDDAAARRPTLDLITEAAQSVRRLETKEELDAEGLRTVWHRGRQQVEMLSWENTDNEIVRQELTVLGMMVVFRRGHGLRTGKIPLADGEAASAGDAKPMSAMMQMDEVADAVTLELASHLLKSIKERDEYGQNLLRLVNLTIAELGYDEGQTAVSAVGAFPRRSPHGIKTVQLSAEELQLQARSPPAVTRPLAMVLDQTKILGVGEVQAERTNNTWVILVGIALGAAGVGLGLLVSYLLGVL